MNTETRARIITDEAESRVKAMFDLRDALRIALEASNKTHDFAGQDYPETTIAKATGVYGLVSRALDLIGEDTEYWATTNEWK